ncbi:hypothetical protein ASG29_13230 [Sphingomonas sp. Leaf412]|uniref:hypothetical protein n=1 Tax=Sphingomonas sp. Leaf412 TaxID=1736370 RepID=UPI0006F612BF|nr:hypothetical protein [Sphingomonas sp. Leaf412]KQT32691.1 hypothetical protein ASG29_13230 [Sphingomonas sp. Leaf412]
MENETPTPDPAVAELAALKAQLAATAATVLAGVPEALRGLIPASMSPAEQLAWFDTAKATGVFDAKPVVPATDSGKPSITPTTPDPSSLPVFARMAGGYRK